MSRRSHPQTLNLVPFVTFTRGRNNYTQARNGSRPNCGETHHPFASRLRQKWPRSDPIALATSLRTGISGSLCLPTD